ncbi:MAG: BrnT family toxin [Acidobacteria bacterium]|nr:BrnT family toxin [Acidobacteriota bacterium]
MKPLRWSAEKNLWLQQHRGVSFEEVAFHLEHDEALDVRHHPNQEKYPGQRIFVLELAEYVYLVPFVEDDDHLFLKTIIPSRKAKKELGK